MQNKNGDHDIRLGEIDGLIVWSAKMIQDSRGNFFKPFAEYDLKKHQIDFVTVEHFFTLSRRNVFRGLHFQGAPHEATKVVSIVSGKVIDYLLDLRIDSPTYGSLKILELSALNPSSVYIPTGIAHGYISLDENSIVSYRQDSPFCPHCDSGVSWKVIEQFLPTIDSPLIISERDQCLDNLHNFEYRTECNL